MTDYRQDQTSMIYDLIDKSNPGFKTLCPPGSMQFGAPVIIPVDPNDPYKNDTTILMSAKPEAGLTIGHVALKYRRINLTHLLHGKSCLLNRWLITTTYPLVAWVPDFATMFGISLTVKDFSSKIGQLFANTVYNLSIEPTSLCYTGAVLVSWVPTIPDLSKLFTNANRALPSFTYPDGSTGGLMPKPLGEFFTYAQDATSIAATLNALKTSYVPAVGELSVGLTTILTWLKANSGKSTWNTGTATLDGGLGNLTWTRYVLPNPLLPEANSAKYNRAVTISSLPDSWFAGTIILHYNG